MSSGTASNKGQSRTVGSDDQCRKMVWHRRMMRGCKPVYVYISLQVMKGGERVDQ